MPHLTLTYDVLNKEGNFSEGDTVKGTVTLKLKKESKIKCLFVKAKGDANVRWEKSHNGVDTIYTGHRRFFKLKEFLIPQGSKDTVIPKGIHVYNFSLELPQVSMPSSFKGSHGKIVYMLEAKLSRSWRMDSIVQGKFNFVSKSILTWIRHLLPPQVGSVEKELGLFSKGQVQMAVIIDRRAVAPGEKVAIIANVKNSSSKKMKPKFTLEQTVVYRVKSETTSSNNVICKMVGHDITPKTEKTISCSMKIPADLTQTILNCDILSVEYFLKVYLDISFAFDPEVKFPLIIVPAGYTSIPQRGGAVDPYPDGAFGGPSNSDFPPPAASMESSPHLSTYPALPQNPAQPPDMSGGYNNPCSQQASPSGYPFSVLSSSPVHGEPPTGPLTFNPPPTAPTYNLPSSDTMMNTDFLSQ